MTTSMQLQFPEDQFYYSTHLTVRVTDINGANHLANDSMISMISEAPRTLPVRHRHRGHEGHAHEYHRHRSRHDLSR
jgi:hypothetical protein